MPVAALPCFEQGMREQGQRTRFFADVAQNQIDQPRFKFPAFMIRGSSMARRNSSLSIGPINS